MSKLEWVMVAVTFGIIVLVVFTADHCNNKMDEVRTQVESINDEWKKFASKNNCKVIESYFGLVEKWVCDDDEIYWR